MVPHTINRSFLNLKLSFSPFSPCSPLATPYGKIHNSENATCNTILTSKAYEVETRRCLPLLPPPRIRLPRPPRGRHPIPPSASPGRSTPPRPQRFRRGHHCRSCRSFALPRVWYRRSTTVPMHRISSCAIGIPGVHHGPDFRAKKKYKA